jgi:hypothetical protein
MIGVDKVMLSELTLEVVHEIGQIIGFVVFVIVAACVAITAIRRD